MPISVDRGPAPPEQDLALQIHVLRGLGGWIGASALAKPLQRRVVSVETSGLPVLLVGHQAEPGEVRANGLDMILGRALGIRVVEAKNEAAAPLARPQPRVPRRADIADMEAARRRGVARGREGQNATSIEEI